MSTNPERPDSHAGSLRSVAGLVVFALLAIAVVLHAVWPRYELTTIGVNRESVVVFDRWTGQFQRVDYLPSGEPRATSVVDPF